MFSKYKKTDAAKPAAKPAGHDNVTPMPEAPKAKVKVQPPKPRAAEVTPMNKEQKRKERLGEIKLELHKALLDNLNLAALENASEKELRQEISSIAGRM